MKLIGLKIDKNPLTVDFMWKPNKKREEDFCYQELYKNLYFKITDPKKITEIMEYFVEKCDEGTSPHKENSDFDEVLDHIAKILDISFSDEDRSYIACIDVSYPETWEVQMLCN